LSSTAAKSLGYLVSVTCSVQTKTSIAAIFSCLLCLWFEMGCTMYVYGWHCNTFSGRFHCVCV